MIHERRHGATTAVYVATDDDLEHTRAVALREAGYGRRCNLIVGRPGDGRFAVSVLSRALDFAVIRSSGNALERPDADSAVTSALAAVRAEIRSPAK